MRSASHLLPYMISGQSCLPRMPRVHRSLLRRSRSNLRLSILLALDCWASTMVKVVMDSRRRSCPASRALSAAFVVLVHANFVSIEARLALNRYYPSSRSTSLFMKRSVFYPLGYLKSCSATALHSHVIRAPRYATPTSFSPHVCMSGGRRFPSL